MEFPGLGQHCHVNTCNRLDFLPMKCDACTQIFCNDHIQYTTHSCQESYKKDNQVPVCPLCNKPIPLKKGEVPDTVVGRHIDSDCQSDPAKERRKVYSNKCSKKGCKVKEMIPVKCDRCQKNVCLRHRFPDDHDCQGFQGSGQGMSKHGAAAINRIQTNTQPKASNSSPQQRNQLNSLGKDLNRERQQRQQQQSGQLQAAQAGLSNEQALALAMQQSMSPADPGSSKNNTQSLTQEEEDLLLAQALAASEEEARRTANNRQGSQQQGQTDNKKSCRIS